MPLAHTEKRGGGTSRRESRIIDADARCRRHRFTDPQNNQTTDVLTVANAQVYCSVARKDNQCDPPRRSFRTSLTAWHEALSNTVPGYFATTSTWHWCVVGEQSARGFCVNCVSFYLQDQHGGKCLGEADAGTGHKSTRVNTVGIFVFGQVNDIRLAWTLRSFNIVDDSTVVDDCKPVAKQIKERQLVEGRRAAVGTELSCTSAVVCNPRGMGHHAASIRPHCMKKKVQHIKPMLLPVLDTAPYMGHSDKADEDRSRELDQASNLSLFCGLDRDKAIPMDEEHWHVGKETKYRLYLLRFNAKTATFSKWDKRFLYEHGSQAPCISWMVEDAGRRRGHVALGIHQQRRIWWEYGQQ